jgi:hypothetical protein
VALTAVGLTVALAQQPVQSSFTGSSTSSGNQVTAAAEFCATPGSASLNAVADTWANESSNSSTSGGDDYYNQVQSKGGADHRLFIRFSTLTSIPVGCALASATLRLYTDTQDAGRTLDAYRADPTVPAWTEANLSWLTQPAAVGTPAAAVTVAANGYLSWNVTSQVRTLYTTANNGFVVRDRTEDDVTGYGQSYIHRLGGTPPKLDLVWN